MVKKGRSFEQKTVDFLTKMQFEAVDGARDDLKIGNFKPDAIGAKEGVLFIIECKDADTFGPQCLQDKMLKFRGRFDEYKSNLKKKTGTSWKHDYSKYKTVWFVLATKDIIVGQTDIEHVRNDKPRLQDIWTSEMMDYYTQLFAKMDANCPVKDPKTGKKCPQCEAKEYWSVYDFMGEIELYKQNVYTAKNIPANVTVKANRTALRNGVILYQFAMNPKDLAPLAYVARRDVRDKAFYQRQIDKGRIEEIGRYISKPNNLLVNNIIMAFDKSADKFIQFPKGYDQGTLKFPLDFKCCWIIDGQHRFYGFRHATLGMKVPIAVLQNLDPVKQAEIFLHINEFQRAVKPELVWDLKDELMFPSTDAMISRTLKKVNSDGIDGIKYTIGIPSQVKNPAGMKKFAAMCLALSDLKLATPATSSGRANPYWKGKNEKTVNELFKGINGFFSAMKQVFPEDFARGHAGFVLGEGSGIVMLSLFERIMQYSIDRSAVTYPDPDENSPTFGQQIPVDLDHNLFVHCLTPIKDEIEDWTTDTTEGDENKLTVARSTCGNKTGQSRYLTSFVRTIRKAIKDETFALGLQGLPEHRDYKLAEEQAHELLDEVLKPKFGEDWLVKSINPSQYNAIKGTATRKAKNIDPHLYHKYATVGQSSEIILGHIDDFADVFLTGKFKFDNRDELKVALAKLREYKADGSHIQPGIGSKTDAQIADNYLVKFKDCIAGYRKEKAKKNAQQALSPAATATGEAILQAKESAEGAEIATDPESSDTLPEQTAESTGQSPAEK